MLVPRHENEYAAVGTVAEVTDHVRIRGGGHAVSLEGLHRGVIGAAHSDALGRLRAEVEERPDENPPPVQTRELEREYRAVVEEILDLRGADDRVREFLRAISEAGALADTCAYAPDISFAQRVELLETVDVVERLTLALELQRERLAELQVRASHPRRRRGGRAEAAARVVPPPADELDPQGARRGRGLGRRRVPDEDRGSRDARGRAGAGRARAAAPRDDGRRERRGVDDPHLPRLADRRAVVEAERRDARSAGREGGPRRRPRRPRGRQGPHRGVPRGAQAPPGPRHPERQALGRDPDPDRAARHRQDVDRRVGRARAQPRVRADVARRDPRRGRDPRPPAHLHRLAAGTARPRAARCRDDEPGDPPRRGGQGRRRLARRPVGGAARGARPGAEPLVPRPLPRRRARSLRGLLHRDRERRGHDPRAAARPDGGHPLRRLHGRREDRDRERLSLAAAGRAERAARGRGLDLGRDDPARRLRVHARGGRPPARARARHRAAQDRDPHRRGPGRGARRGRRGGRAGRARPPEVLPGGRGADGCPGRGDRSRRDRHGRRRPVRRGDLDGRRRTASSSSRASSAT